jgi:hypothetical protein
MALVHQIADLSVFSAGGTSLLGDIESVEYTVDETQVDGSKTSRLGKNMNGVKLEGKIRTSLLSTISGTQRVSHLNLTAATLNSVNYLGLIRNFKFSATYEHQRRAGVGSWFMRNQVTAKHFTASFDLDCEDSIASVLMIAAHSSTYGNREMVLSFTLNSVVITLPTRLKTVAFKTERDGLQVLSITVEGSDPGTGNYPTAPTTSATLLTKALNDPTTEIAFDLTSKAASGFDVTGTMTWDTMDFEVADDGLVKTNYSWMSYGTVTASAT